jgi:hypothetical protein
MRRDATRCRRSPSTATQQFAYARFWHSKDRQPRRRRVRLLRCCRRDMITPSSSLHNALPASYPARENAEAGGLMSYGTWQNRAHGAACPQLARADVRPLTTDSGFDPKATWWLNKWYDIQSKTPCSAFGVTTDPIPRAADAKRLTEAFRRSGVVDPLRLPVDPQEQEQVDRERRLEHVSILSRPKCRGPPALPGDTYFWHAAVPTHSHASAAGVSF